ncbi:MAG: hypothetical protein RL179_431 [Planctomycetota bacterium]
MLIDHLSAKFLISTTRICDGVIFMKLCKSFAFSLFLVTVLVGYPVSGQQKKEELFLPQINLHVPPIGSDNSVKYDFDIVYVRTPRKGDKAASLWAEIAHPSIMDPKGDLILLHPDGREEILVEGGEDGSVTDPYVSFDGKWVYYSHIQGLKGTSQHGQFPFKGADIFKIHVPSRKIVQLTHQEWTPNTGAAKWADDIRKPEKDKTSINYGVLNLGPCPLPGGRIVFTSNRNAFKPPKHPSPCMQLFVMDEDGKNVEMIGHLNIGMALHPAILKDGRIVFSSLESQGLRNSILWGLWQIHPDGTNWGPLLSAFDTGGAPNAFHFQTQLSDGHIIAEEYYNQNNSGFGAYLKFPPQHPDEYSAFGPASLQDARNPPMRFGRHYNGKGKYYRLPFSPFGIESFTPFALNGEGPADPSSLGDKSSSAVGKFTHPSGSPDNHLLTCYSPGPVNHQYPHYPMPDGGLYLIKNGKPVVEPSQMLLIKNDPNFNEQWPRALVPYKRIYGTDEPKKLAQIENNGKLSPLLPPGTPFGMIGTSSFYKRESYPGGAVPPGSVTATYAGPKTDGYQSLDPFNTSENGASLNWFNQGSDAGKYTNEDIHAVRILVMEPTTDRNQGFKQGRRFYSHAQERLRILGEIPLRHFIKEGGTSEKQVIDPDGNPDTSFLARIPADTAFTFQTIDKEGMVLNMAQNWHQVRPGEIRNNCGGCHAHSQKPTLFEKTAASREDYQIFDLTKKTPLLTTKANDQSSRVWDSKNETGLRYEEGIKNVEYFRNIKPLLDRSCISCHTQKVDNPPAKLVLDDDKFMNTPNGPAMPGTYFRLAYDSHARFGHKPVIQNGEWRQTNASRYIRKFQSRRSLLTWKIMGKRTDGWTNDDFPTEITPGDAGTLLLKGVPIAGTPANRNLADLDYNGMMCPPPESKGPPLSPEDKLTFIRWIDLGCPIDLDFDPSNLESRGYGWMLDDNRPTLALAYPKPNVNPAISKILVGMHDYYTGLNLSTFKVIADFPINDIPPGDNLASHFRKTADGVWELMLNKPITSLRQGRLFVEIKDHQGNTTRIERVFSVGVN